LGTEAEDEEEEDCWFKETAAFIFFLHSYVECEFASLQKSQNNPFLEEVDEENEDEDEKDFAVEFRRDNSTEIASVMVVLKDLMEEGRVEDVNED
jgi:hypothetical protein